MSRVFFLSQKCVFPEVRAASTQTLQDCNTALLAGPRGRVDAVGLGHSEPGTCTNFAISLLIFIEQGDESSRSGNHTVIAICNIEEGGYKIFSLPPLEL